MMVRAVTASETAKGTPDEILRRTPPRPWCVACGEDWTDEPCCDVRREILRLSERVELLEAADAERRTAKVEGSEPPAQHPTGDTT